MTVIDPSLTFDGGVSTADQFSTPRDFSGATVPFAAFLWDLDLSNGPIAVTLQINADNTGVTTFGWEDVATPSIRVLDTVSSALLDQTDSAIQSSKIRSGIFKGASTTGTFLLQFKPTSASYRLRFQISAASLGTVNSIIAVP